MTRVPARPLSSESGRKQKTPKKFTGEQPSISGTFGLKGRPGQRACGTGRGHRCACARAHACPTSCARSGLAKAEDKARGYRAKKQEGPSPEDMRKKVPPPASNISKEAPAPGAHPASGRGSCWGAGGGTGQP